eukprot:TRINITY_DN17862_c1_g1_i1.p1 TRINITY_DN17862_c1_g1~~TRINITY_DN17862_c1_g1_i1.p1  ORF type:complete len:914 (-),score=216.55 TRINITY_DN17862_c1_g1_i1:106-2787(-)
MEPPQAPGRPPPSSLRSPPPQQQQQALNGYAYAGAAQTPSIDSADPRRLRADLSSRGAYTGATASSAVVAASPDDYWLHSQGDADVDGLGASAQASNAGSSTGGAVADRERRERLTSASAATEERERRRRREQGNYGQHITQRLSEIQDEMAYQRLDQKTVLQNVLHSHRQQEVVIEMVSGVMRELADLRLPSKSFLHDSCKTQDLSFGDAGPPATETDSAEAEAEPEASDDAKPRPAPTPRAPEGLEASVSLAITSAMQPVQEALRRMETIIEGASEPLPLSRQSSRQQLGDLLSDSPMRSSRSSIFRKSCDLGKSPPGKSLSPSRRSLERAPSKESFSEVPVRSMSDQALSSRPSVTSLNRDSLVSDARGATSVSKRKSTGSGRPPSLASPRDRYRRGMSSLIGEEQELANNKSKTIRTLGLRFSTGSRCRRCTDWLAGFLERAREPEREGFLADVAGSKLFENFTAMVILMNATCVAFTSNWEITHIGEDTPMSFKVIEMMFLGYYTLELWIRLLVHRFYFFCFGAETYWNWFDLLLVMLSWQDAYLTFFVPLDAFQDDETGSNFGFMRIFRLAKLAKILRAVRVIKVFRELSLILDSFKKSACSLFWCFVMLAFVLYVFALIFLQGLAAHLATSTVTPEDKALALKWFGSVDVSMCTLYKAVTGGNDWDMYYRVVGLCGQFYDTAFLFFTFFFIFALFNILTGIFVEKSVAAGQPDRDELIMRQCRKSKREAEEFRILCRHFDSDQTGTISFDEFVTCMQSERMVSYMASVGLEIHDVEMFFKIVAGAGDYDEVNIDRFVEGCMSMKGQASGLDMQRELFQTCNLFRYVREFDQHVQLRLDDMQNLAHETFRRLDALAAPSFGESRPTALDGLAKPTLSRADSFGVMAV